MAPDIRINFFVSTINKSVFDHTEFTLQNETR